MWEDVSRSRQHPCLSLWLLYYYYFLIIILWPFFLNYLLFINLTVQMFIIYVSLFDSAAFV